ncbi:hypothetical protein [Nocardia lasii]|uniref:Uncharacterized protein n=1 Tax=Nocardia lasii TaxID=1616107 RepID=A0ABW1JYQ7_9NOCA
MKYQRSGSVITLWVLAACWCALSLGYGVASLFEARGVDSTEAGHFYASILVGVLPLGGVLLHERGEARRAMIMQARRLPPPPRPVAPPPNRPAAVRGPQLPHRLKASWFRLDKAYGVVSELQRRGWIDATSTRGLSESMARLHRLGVADGMTDQLGGRRSGTVERQINRLADLLVALADEAVEHQATVGADFTPATLAEAAQRLAADRVAYCELLELGGIAFGDEMPFRHR